MRYGQLDDFLAQCRAAPVRGPVALLMAEDDVELARTVDHHARAGFRTILLLAHPALDLDEETAARVQRIDHDPFAPDALVAAVNRLIPAVSGQWLYYGYNAEFLFYPFCETRTVGEMLAFHTEERREAMLSYVIDLYAGDLGRFPNAVSVSEAMLDRSGYYALARPDPSNHGHPKERQLDFFGGLRWRFEEHVPPDRRKIDRIALVRARPGLVLRRNFTFEQEELNTYACPWHNNITAAICSFRTAKALKSNPGSRHEIPTFLWRNSVRFDWTSQQLMDLGLMEPGQWF
ncbi:glycosyltransferase family 2 protein [Rhodobacter sp. NSM]|uniref:glycosyltransferase family 2 protein n=1 Tax=Rhodobacter sp. NSM TaxID=3457501 RepID=UPI003FD0A5DA